MPVDPTLENKFDTENDVRRVLIQNSYTDTRPFWIDQPRPAGGHPGNPNPGKQGILSVHAKGPGQPCTILRKVALPADKISTLRLVVSGDPYEIPGQSDFVLQAGVVDGGKMKWFDQQVINNGDYMAKSTMMAIMSRMSAYTGQSLTWDEAFQSQEDLSPSGYTWDATPPKSEVAVPGVTQFS